MTPWAAVTEPLPESLYDLYALTRLRPIVYAVIHALTWSVDDSLGLIRRLVEIDRRITLIERRGLYQGRPASTPPSPSLPAHGGFGMSSERVSDAARRPPPQRHQAEQRGREYQQPDRFRYIDREGGGRQAEHELPGDKGAADDEIRHVER
jgi:hypothetical protein